jgi:putative transport protein
VESHGGGVLTREWLAAWSANPLLVLFTIIAVGYPLGRLRIFGFSLGIAAVLFAGIAAGALHPDSKLPELVYQLGLVLFVYTLGLANGTTFFASFRRQGLRDSVFVAAVLCGATAFSALLARGLGLDGPTAAGVFAGSLTNTPALAAVLESLKHSAAESTILAQPVVAYSVAYPMGVAGMMLAIVAFEWWFGIDYVREALRADGGAAAAARIVSRTVEVTRAEACRNVKELIRENDWHLVFGRLERAGALSLIDGDEVLRQGDHLTITGSARELDAAEAFLGRRSDEALELSREEMDSRFVFVSKHDAAGVSLRELALPARFGALVTRVRRGDVELVPGSGTVLQLGDHVRVLARRRDLDAVSRFFGDSQRALSEIDVLTFSLGLGVGLAVGMLAIPLPGGITVRLGLAGGPLVVALLLGAVGRMGGMIWTLPHSANQTVRQLGLILFLAGVGTRAGDAFVTTVRGGHGALLFGAGACVTAAVAFATLWTGFRVLRIPMGVLTGMLAAVQTQPAVLAFAQERSGDDLPGLGYARVYPVATILKIVLAQVLLAVTGR